MNTGEEKRASYSAPYDELICTSYSLNKGSGSRAALKSDVKHDAVVPAEDTRDPCTSAQFEPSSANKWSTRDTRMPHSESAIQKEILCRQILESVANTLDMEEVFALVEDSIPSDGGKSHLEEMGKFACTCADFLLDDVSVNENCSLDENGNSDHISDNGSLDWNDDAMVPTGDTRDLGTSVQPESSSANNCSTGDTSVPPLESASEEEIFCRLTLESLANSQHEMAGKFASAINSIPADEVKSHFDRMASLACSCADFLFDDVSAEDKKNCSLDKNGDTDHISDNGRSAENDRTKNGGFDRNDGSSNLNAFSHVFLGSSGQIPGEGSAMLHRTRSGTTGGSACTGPASRTNDEKESLINAADKIDDDKAASLNITVTKEEQDLEDLGSLGQSPDVSYSFLWTDWNPFTENVSQTDDVDKSPIQTADKIEDNKAALPSITDTKEERDFEDSGSLSSPREGSVMSYLYPWITGIPCTANIFQTNDDDKAPTEEADKSKDNNAAPLAIIVTIEEQNLKDSGCVEGSPEEGLALSYELLTGITCDSPSTEQVFQIKNKEESLALVKVASRTTLSVSWADIEAADKLENKDAAHLNKDTTEVQGQTPIKEADEIKDSKAPLDIAVTREEQKLEDSGCVESSPEEGSALSHQIRTGMTGDSPSTDQVSQIKNKKDSPTLVKVDSWTTFSVTGADAEATDKLEDKNAAPLIAETTELQGHKEEQVLEESPSMRARSEEGLATREKETGVNPALTLSRSKADVTTPETVAMVAEEECRESVSTKVVKDATYTQGIAKRRIVKLVNFSLRREKFIIKKNQTSRGEEGAIKERISKPKKRSQRRKIMNMF